MNRIEFNKLAEIADVSKELPRRLLMSTSFTPAAKDQFTPAATGARGGEDNFDKMLGGGAEEQYNTRDALAARARKKKKNAAVMMMQDIMREDYGLDDIGGDIFPWSRRLHRARRVRGKGGDLDGRRTATDADRKRVVTDEDGRRIIVDKDGRVATDAEGKRITIEEGGHRIAEVGDGRKVVVNPEGRVLNGPDGKPISVDDAGGHKIKTQADGTRVATSANGKDKIVMANAPEPKIVTESPEVPRAPVIEDNAPRVGTVPDAPDTVRVAPAIDSNPATDFTSPRAPAIPDAPRAIELGPRITAAPEAPKTPVIESSTPRVGTTPDAPDIPKAPDSFRATPSFDTVADLSQPRVSSDFDNASGRQSQKFASFLTENGVSLDDFRKQIDAAAGSPDVPRGADIDIPSQRLNTSHVRSGRFIRMITPNGFDILLSSSVAVGVAAYAGAEAGAMDKLTGGSTLSAVSKAAWAGKKEGAETLFVAGTTIAFSEGRTAEGTVRAIEDVVEVASPFVMAGVGAGIGAAGTSWSGPGAAAGAVVGGVIGFFSGVVISLTASEVTRAVARGIGFDDVDRGMIGAWLAPEYAEAMEGWIRTVTKDGKGMGENESLSDVMERINDGTETSQERIGNFREFLDVLHTGILHNQTQQIDGVKDRISRDTGIEADKIQAALRLPETRAQITAFYEDQLAASPDDQDIGNILQTLNEFGNLEEERIKLVAARVGTDAMSAKEMNEKLLDSLSYAGRLSMIAHNMDSRWNMNEADKPVADDLAAINYKERLAAIQRTLSDGADMNAGEVIRNVFTNGTTAYEEMGTSSALAEAYNLTLDLEQQLLQSQQSVVDRNWDELRRYISADAQIERFWSSDRTLLEELENKIKDARANMDEGEIDHSGAKELSALLENTDNLKNVTPETATQLLNNPIFRSVFGEVLSDADADDLNHTFFRGAFASRASILEDVRKQRATFEGVGGTYGFDIGVSDGISPEAKPAAARALTTEAEPEPAGPG